MNTDRRTKAFTLIELLTVIAIIGVLVALLFPAIKSALLRAETTKAQTAISGLSTAFRSYYTEYGKWPVADTIPANSNLTYTVDTNFVALLQGADNTASLTGGSSAPPPPFSPVSTSILQRNPRRIRFLEFKQADLDPKVGLLDPWKGAYYCRFDQSYANDVTDPFNDTSANPTKVNAGFLIWSAGPDGQFNSTCGDPPGPYTEPPPCVNKDNAKSW
jgi:prepilin-type N-terminal cleavage/methylation domain-containing protein